MKILFSKTLLGLALVLGASATASAYEIIKPDPQVRVGKLDNGLTYYIRHNNYPEHHADFFIAQNVGSIQEEDNQRGLAHFLEHMCFNGTKHFPGNSLISYMESIGVKFGANLNAYTSTDETVYNISNVPTARRSALDSCFLALSDWSGNLLLKGKDIDNERGVIEGEYRYRQGAANRMLEKSAPIIYAGSKYAHRLPIGLMSVVKNFKHKDLRAYYKKWYHPSNQAIIVVGDIDPDYAEAKIKQLFSGFKNPANPAPVVSSPVPDNESLIVDVQTDKEQTTTLVRLFFKHDGLPDSDMPTTRFLENKYLNNVVSAMFTARFDNLLRDPQSPFTSVVGVDRNFLISKNTQAFQIVMRAKPGQAAQAVQVATRELKRAYTFGFTEGEFRRARINYETGVEELYKNRNRYSNTRYARDFVKAFISGEPIPSVEEFAKISGEITKSVTLCQVNAYFKSIISPDDRNVVISAYCPDKQGIAVPTQQQLADAFHTAKAETLTAYVDSVTSGKILAKEPKPGKVVSSSTLPQFQANMWTLSNGIKVYYRKTDFDADQVLIGASGPGGLSQDYTPADAPSFKVFGNVVALSGFGPFTSVDIKKMLAGKKVKINPFVSRTEEGVSGSCSPKDLETALQLMYLKLTSLQKDEKAFEQFLEQNRNRVLNQNADPKFEFADSIFACVFNHHPLGGERLNKQEIEQVNYDRILQVYKNRMSDLSDWNFYIVGNFNVDSLKLLTERYIASLPTARRIEKPRDIGYRMFPADTKRAFSRKMENPQDKVYFFWTNNNVPYSLRTNLLAKISGQVMSAIFLKEIREDRGWTYHVDTHCSIVADLNGQDTPVIFMPLNVTITAGKAAECRNLISATMASVAKNGITQAQLDKVKRYLKKVFGEDVKENSYWQVMIKNYLKYGIDFNQDYLSILDSITTTDVRDFVKQYITGGHHLELTMTAEK